MIIQVNLDKWGYERQFRIIIYCGLFEMIVLTLMNIAASSDSAFSEL